MGKAKGPLTTRCKCGSVRLELDPAGVSAATRLRCYCHDCQSASRHLGHDLPAHGGTDLVHTTPDRLTIVSGQENLAILRLGPRGLCRWYAKCCGTPMFSVLPKPGRPFLGLSVHDWETGKADQVVGPVWGHAFTASAPKGGGAPARDAHFAGVGLKIVTRMLGAYLTGRTGQNPLLTPAGDWFVTPTVLTREQRAAARRSA
ncbi:DUF6151 family protein [Thalassovita sp.]|uniref:DUF6151 family protein n=1 Tax=Thalassovita sp. TaxID=1979401 RepID=UPI0029DE8DAA|nr:DUF6151 family protein [Thalassovita sp.]